MEKRHRRKARKEAGELVMERENRSILLKNKKNLGGVKLKQLGAKISIEFPGSLSKKSHMTGIYSRPLAEENVDRYTCCPGSDF